MEASLRGQGIAVPAGAKHTRLADSMWAAMRVVLPRTNLPGACNTAQVPPCK